MRHEDTPTVKHNQAQSSEGTQRMGLLGQRFSDAEIAHLSALQLRCRERPDALDRLDEDDHLRFARWLVEHGRLSEDDGTGSWRPPRVGEALRAKWPQRGQPEPAGDRAHGDCDGELGTVSVRRMRRAHWRLILRGGWTRVCQGLVRAAGSGRELGNRLCLPQAIDSWRAWEPFSGAYPYPEAQWYWMYLWPRW